MRKIALFITVFGLFIFGTTTVFAASTNFLQRATEFYQRNCKNNPPRTIAISCYLFDKVSELQQENTLQTERITALETRVKALESQPSPTATPTPTPTPITNSLTLANNVPTNQNGNAINIPSGYKSMTIKVTSSNVLSGWSPQVSFDGGNTWYEQHRFDCGSTSCPEITIPILSQLYRISPGSGNGTFSATGTLNVEPNAQVSTFGQGVNYPFTSWSFSTNGMSSITITTGGGDNPQNLTGIVLQRLENGSFVTKHSLTCDGGAKCPLQSLPVIDGTYRFVIEGNGTGGLFGAIIRP